MKNKILLWMVILLLIANAATIATFWLTRKNTSAQPPMGSPVDYLSKELNFDGLQRTQLEKLIKEHREAADSLRPKIKEAKDVFFGLMKEYGITDSTRRVKAHAVSEITEQLDLLTYEHFEKIRAICSVDQKKKFDAILRQVTGMMAPAGPGMGRPGGPPPGGDHPPEVPH